MLSLAAFCSHIYKDVSGPHPLTLCTNTNKHVLVNFLFTIFSLILSTITRHFHLQCLTTLLFLKKKKKHLTRWKCLYLFVSLQLNPGNTKPQCVSPFTAVCEFLSTKKQHPLTQSGLTMPSCFSIACLAKRYSSGSSSQNTNTRTRASVGGDFWKLLHCRYLILMGGADWGTGRSCVVDVFWGFFCIADIHHTHSYDSHQCTISLTWHPNCRTYQLSTSDRNLQRSWNTFFSFFLSFSRPLTMLDSLAFHIAM